MTCIVGLVENGEVFIGGDSAGVAGLSLTIRSDSKVFRNGPYIMGFAGSFRAGQLLRYALKPPAPEGDLDQFMVTTFINAVRDCFKAGGIAEKDKEVERGNFFLVGINGRLFNIESDYQVGIDKVGYSVIGCGQDFALGSLYATTQIDFSPRERVVEALKTAAFFSAGVVAPFKIISSKK